MSGKRSVIPPGWMPVPWSVLPPAAQAASMAVVSIRFGYTQPSGVTMSRPASRIRQTSFGFATIGL